MDDVRQYFDDNQAELGPLVAESSQWWPIGGRIF
jgi:hypothetical protein